MVWASKRLAWVEGQRIRILDLRLSQGSDQGRRAGRISGCGRGAAKTGRRKMAARVWAKSGIRATVVMRRMGIYVRWQTRPGTEIETSGGGTGYRQEQDARCRRKDRLDERRGREAGKGKQGLKTPVWRQVGGRRQVMSFVVAFPLERTSWWSPDPGWDGQATPTTAISPQ